MTITKDTIQGIVTVLSNVDRKADANSDRISALEALYNKQQDEIAALKATTQEENIKSNEVEILVEKQNG